MAILVLFMAGASAMAADYPTKPITLINPMAPGGSHDVLGRAFASVAEKYLGQPVVVVNKPGATGMLGTLAGAQAAPDGYTLTETSANTTCAVEFEIIEGRKAPFTRKDFINIAAFNMSPTLIIVPYDSPWKTLKDMTADAKAKPGHYAYCSGGKYGMSHVPAEILANALSLKFRHVPFSGGGPCITAVVGKHVDFGTQYPSTCVPLIRGNKLRALAVQSDRRLKALPEVPCAKELGVNAEYYGWVGISVPLKTPAPIVEKLRDVVKKVAADKAYIEMIEKLGDDVRFKVGEDLDKFWDSESEMVADLFKTLVREEKK
ncbi:MAG: tripartite tricarboxylate transporter substrate binding protein [Deltaproteobacteria bacterium]|nr:MAG: tripartite tricarboxylate transporter substrate binding protein [Deltaproteobacteria bacterium]